MGKHVRGREALAPSKHSIPVPTVGQVLVRALPAAIMMLAGFPLLAQNEESSFTNHHQASNGKPASIMMAAGRARTST